MSCLSEELQIAPVPSFTGWGCWHWQRCSSPGRWLCSLQPLQLPACISHTADFCLPFVVRSMHLLEKVPVPLRAGSTDSLWEELFPPARGRAAHLRGAGHPWADEASVTWSGPKLGPDRTFLTPGHYFLTSPPASRCCACWSHSGQLDLAPQKVSWSHRGVTKLPHSLRPSCPGLSPVPVLPSP